MLTDLHACTRRLEDRALISEQVITYALAVGRGDLVAIVRDDASGYTGTQHLSPNHVIEFDDSDADRAICYSYMYAQYHDEDSDGGDLFLLRGSYTNHMLRTSDGWRIERLVQHDSWRDSP